MSLIEKKDNCYDVIQQKINLSVSEKNNINCVTIRMINIYDILTELFWTFIKSYNHLSSQTIQLYKMPKKQEEAKQEEAKQEEAKQQEGDKNNNEGIFHGKKGFIFTQYPNPKITSWRFPHHLLVDILTNLYLSHYESD